MDLELTGKRAIVTGGSVGIGKATARELAKEGVDVVICARRQDILEATAQELESETGRRIVPVVADTTSTESVNAMVQARRRRARRHRHPGQQRSRARRTRPGPTARVRRRRPALRHQHQGCRLLPLRQGRRATHAEPGLGTHHQYRRTRRQERRHLQRTQKRRARASHQDAIQPSRPGRNQRQPCPSRSHCHRAHLGGSRERAPGQRHRPDGGRHRDWLRRDIPRLSKSTAIAGEVVAAGGGVGSSVYQ